MTTQHHGGKAISAKTAALIADPARLHRLRWQYAHDAQVSADLATLAEIALQWHTRSGCPETTELVIDNPPVPSLELTTKQAAQAAGVVPAAIHRAAREGRLTAVKRAGTWWINPSDLAAYIAQHR